MGTGAVLTKVQYARTSDLIILIFGCLVLSFLVFVLSYNYYAQRTQKRYHYQIQSKALPKQLEGCKILFLSDLHDQLSEKRKEFIRKTILQEKPELILIGGDMIVGKHPPKDHNVESFLVEIAKNKKVYYSFGNHEQKWASDFSQRKQFQSYLDQLTNQGISILRNESHKVMLKNQCICIAGLELGLDHYQKWHQPMFNSELLRSYLGEKPDVFTILMAHNPMYFDSYQCWGADLVVSGHVHGGLIRLPFFGGVISPQLRLFPKYDAGLFHKKDTSMVVSRGLGMHSIQLRLFNIPEISIITLKKTT